MPLEHHYLVGHRLHPMHVEQDGILLPNPYVVSLDQHELKTKTYYRRGSGTPQHQQISRPREGHRRVYVPRREEVVEVLADEGMLPAIYFVFSRAGCDKSVRWLRESGVRLTTRAEADHIRERAETRLAWMDEEDLETLGLLRLPGRADGGHRRAPRRDAPRVQGDGRGAVRGGAREGRVRHRDPLARHQHAREDRRDRGPVEVPGRAARDPHARGVHAAHRASGPAGDRRPGPRGGRLSAAGALRARGRARRHAHVQPHLVVPALLQHGREPRAQLHARAGPPAAELVVRAVPGRPRGRGARADPRSRTSTRWRGTARTWCATSATSPSTGRCARRLGGCATRTGVDASGRERTPSATPWRSSARRGDPRSPGQAARARRGRVLARREAHRALAGPDVLPADGEGLRRNRRSSSRGSCCRDRGAAAARGTGATSRPSSSRST